MKHILIILSAIHFSSCSQDTGFKSGLKNRKSKNSYLDNDRGDYNDSTNSSDNLNKSPLVVENNSNINSVDDISDACSGETLSLEETISFPSQTKQCPWGVGDNLAKRDRKNTARIDQRASVSIPQNSVICSTKIESQTSEVEYDDTIYMSIDKFLIFASSGAPFSRDKNGLSIYSWDKVKNENFDNEHMCIGPCEIPESEKEELFSINIPDDSAEKIAFSIKEKTKIDFTLTTMGDNDSDSDCSHSGIDFRVSIRYAKP